MFTKLIFLLNLLLISNFVIAQITDLRKVQVFRDGNFSGASQFFAPGVYTVGQLDTVGNDQLTGLIVPFGLCVDLDEHTDNKTDGNGFSKNYQPGLYPFVPAQINDKVSKITVYPWTDIYLSTDDKNIPSKIDVLGIKHSTTTEGKDGSFSFVLDLSSSDKKYYKKVTYQIPTGYTVKVWEATANGKKEGRSGWDYKINNGQLLINVWVKVRDVAGPRNWIGVRASIEPLKKE